MTKYQKITDPDKIQSGRDAVDDMTDEEARAWVRGNVIQELKELAGNSEES